MFVPTQSAPVSDDQPLDVTKPTTIGGKKKKVAKRKTSPSKVTTQKRSTVSGSSRMESNIDILTDSGHPITPPVHSSELPFGALISLAHTYEESPHNPPSSS